MGKKFDETEAGFEYVKQLLSGKEDLPKDASFLEKTALETMKQRTQKARDVAQQRAQHERTIESLRAAIINCGAEIDQINGEITGYGRMLALAEGERRALKEAVETSSDVANVAPAKVPQLKVAGKPGSKPKANGQAGEAKTV